MQIKSNFAKMMLSFCNRLENILGKGGSAGYKHFLPFPQFFQKHSGSELGKPGCLSVCETLMPQNGPFSESVILVFDLDFGR